MRRLAKHLSRPLLWLPLAAFAGCSLFAPEAPGPAAGTVPGHDLIASIRAAGDREKFIVDVSPLRDSGVTSLVEAAQRDEQARQYAAAAAKLDQALALSPDAPDLLQDRAEAAIGMRDFGRAEQLARHSWSIGPKLGSLCARNRQTIVVTRLQAGDLVGATAAQQSVQQCHKAAVTRL